MRIWDRLFDTCLIVAADTMADLGGIVREIREESEPAKVGRVRRRQSPGTNVDVKSVRRTRRDVGSSRETTIGDTQTSISMVGHAGGDGVAGLRSWARTHIGPGFARLND